MLSEEIGVHFCLDNCTHAFLYLCAVPPFSFLGVYINIAFFLCAVETSKPFLQAVAYAQSGNLTGMRSSIKVYIQLGYTVCLGNIYDDTLSPHVYTATFGIYQVD